MKFYGARVPEHYNRGVKLLARKEYNKALSFFRKEEVPFKELYLNMGSCYSFLGADNKAYQYYNLAVDSDLRFADGSRGPYPEALNNLGIVLYSRECDLQSIPYYDAALAADPSYHDARWHRSLSMLRQVVSGNSDISSELAFSDYDFRFYLRAGSTGIDKDLPLWDGVSSGSSIVVLSEQGVGDTFQWMRYVKDLERYFTKVWVQLPRSLHAVHASYNVIERLSECDAEVCVPICSLSRHFGITMTGHDYLPRTKGYDFGTTGLKVGVVGEGSVLHTNNHRRSCGMHQFLKLISPGVNLYNLTPGARTIKGIVNLNPRSWCATVDYLCGLDLVITVDTSVAHLAGVLGVPCWVLMPISDTDWRWGDSSCGTNNVWYPTVTVFRNPNNWDTVFRVVKECLSDFNSKQT